MTISYPDVGYVTEADSRKDLLYEVLEVTDVALRVKLNDESRLDSNGKQVIWHIKLVDDNTFCWGGMIGLLVPVHLQE